MSGRCRRVSGWYLWKLDVLGCVLGSHPLQYGAVTLFWHRPERHHFFSPDHTETSKYQNVHIWGWQKWLGYMISLFLSARQKDIKNGSCIWTPCSPVQASQAWSSSLPSAIIIINYHHHDHDHCFQKDDLPSPGIYGEQRFSEGDVDGMGKTGGVVDEITRFLQSW